MTVAPTLDTSRTVNPDPDESGPLQDRTVPILDISHAVKTFDITGGFLDQLAWRDGRPIRKRTTSCAP